MAPSRVLFAALLLAAVPLLSCSRGSVVGPVDGRNQGLVLSDADIAACPGGPVAVESAVPAKCGYPPSYGKGNGKGTMKHHPTDSDRPGQNSTFNFEFDGTPEENGPVNIFANPADTLPRGWVQFRSAAKGQPVLSFVGGDPYDLFVVQVDMGTETTTLAATPSKAGPPPPVDVGGPGTIYAAGEGQLNGQPGWFFCLFAKDREDTPGSPPNHNDALDIRLWEGETNQAVPQQLGGTCDDPVYRFNGKAISGHIDAQEGDETPP